MLTDECKQIVLPISLKKVNTVLEEYRLLCFEVQNINYPAINDRMSHIISAILFLHYDYVGKQGETDIPAQREEYEQFMNTVLKNEELDIPVKSRITV